MQNQKLTSRFDSLNIVVKMDVNYWLNVEVASFWIVTKKISTYLRLNSVKTSFLKLILCFK